ncbi:MAG: hypothetical protein Q7K20_11790 [Polaromonas sp.]|jgi:hypothetical protein|nr:hypothetical protein [Polaromonas sp.]
MRSSPGFRRIAMRVGALVLCVVSLISANLSAFSILQGHQQTLSSPGILAASTQVACFCDDAHDHVMEAAGEAEVTAEVGHPYGHIAADHFDKTVIHPDDVYAMPAVSIPASKHRYLFTATTAPEFALERPPRRRFI